MKPILFLLFTVMSLLAVEPVEKDPPPVTPLEQRVIELAITNSNEAIVAKRHAIQDTASLQTFVFPSSTLEEFTASLRHHARSRDEAFKEALEDFIRKNPSDVKLVFPKALPKNMQLVSQEVVRKIFSVPSKDKPNGWDIFYQRFPQTGGLITISRPGIDSKSTVAIIYVGQQSHYLMGSGQFYIFKFIGKKWILQKDVFGPTWVS